MMNGNIKNIDGKPLKLKIENRKKVFKLFRNNPNLSAINIAKSTNLSKTTVGKSLAFLLEKGFIVEDGKGKSTYEGGKRPDLYSINKDSGYVISILIAPIFIKCSVFNFSYDVSDYKEYSIKSNESLDVVLKYIISYIEDVLKKYKGINPNAIGLGCDGIIDYSNSIIKLATHFPSWGTDIKIDKIIHSYKNIKTDIAIDNAIRLLAYAENINETKNVVTICSEVWGLAGSFVKYGEIERGLNSLIGEIGHIVVNHTDDVKCSCSSYGCFEANVDIKRVIANAKKNRLKNHIEKLNNIAAINEIFYLSNNGNKDAISVIENVAKWFVIAIRNIILIYDPHLIIIQGIYSHAGDYFIDYIRKNVESSVLSNVKKITKIEYSSINEKEKNPYLLSSAIQVINSYFDRDNIYI